MSLSTIQGEHSYIFYTDQQPTRKTLRRMEAALKTPNVPKVLQESGNVTEEGWTYKVWRNEAEALKQDKKRKPLA